MRLVAVFVCCLASALLTPADGFAAQDGPAARLTVHDVGEYGAWPWGKPGAPIKPGSREDRVRDLNLSVASVNLSDNMTDAFLARWAETARWGKEQGKKLLPRVYFWDGSDRYEGPMRDIEVYWRRLDRFLAAIDPRDLHGIVLAEENVSYAGRPEVLTELYHRVKAKYRIPVWQWWSPGGAVPSSGGWIPADGWVIDEYFMPRERFRRYLRKYLITGLPVIVMPWAETTATAKPLTQAQWQANQGQLDAAVEFGLPVAFYWTYGPGAQGYTTCYFGCDRGDPKTEIDRINHWVWRSIGRARSLPKGYQGLPSADRAEGSVVEIAPNREGRLVYEDTFADEKCVDEASMAGFRDVVLDGKVLTARGFGGRKVNASLSYRFEGDFAANEPRISVTATCDAALGGRVELALSTDGKRWDHATATRGGGTQRLSCTSAGDPRFRNLRRFYARVRLTGRPGTLSAPPVRLDDLRIEASVPPPQNTEAHLKPVPGRPGQLFYEDDFRTEKYRFTTTRTDDEHLEWSPGAISVRLRPGGMHPALVWKVTSGQALQGVAVEVTGRANEGSFGARHRLDVSLDGRMWSHEVSTGGRTGDVNGWVDHGLRIDLAGDARFEGVRELYVRLRMDAPAYEKVHPAQAGIITRLRVEAEAAGRQRPGAAGRKEKRMRPLALHPDNPHYFLFRGKPTVLITSGEHYGAVLNGEFDHAPYLEELRSHGLNLTRLFVGSYREVPGSFNIQGNTLAPKPETYVAPWPRTDTPPTGTPGADGRVERGLDGGAKFDLKRWNEAYFPRLRSFCAEAGRRGIVVEVVLFCPFYEDVLWQINPMNAANNVNGIGAVPRTEALTMQHPDLVAVHEALTRRIAAELKDLDNVYYEICNEPYFGGVTLDWQHHIAGVIAQAEDGFPYRHLIAQNIANGSAKVEDPHPVVSILNFHYASPPDAVGVNYALGRPIAFDETGFAGTRDATYRAQAWEFLLAGGSVFSNLDYSFTAGHEDGTFQYPESQPGGGSTAFRQQLGILKRFLEGFDFLRMAPATDVVRGGVPEGAGVRVLAERGKAYALYLRGGTEARPLLDLPAGRYRAEWLNTRSGQVEKREDLRHAGGEATLASPLYHEDIALRIVAAR